MRLDGIPRVSVVVASSRDRHLLDACLESLLEQADACGAEIVVARTEDDSFESLIEAYPGVEFVRMPEGSSIPVLRGAGMAKADGDIVLLTEDHCAAAPDWISTMVDASRGGFGVVGGSMKNAREESMVDWGAFFSEYGFFAERGGGDEDAPLLTAANVAYDRDSAKTASQLALEGEWESAIHHQLARSGKHLFFVRSAAVSQNNSYRFWDFCRDRYQHGRDFASRRLVGAGALRRLMYMIGSPLLPVLLTLRVGQSVALDDRRAFWKALPFTVSFLTAWSIGEAVGYARGAGPRLPE